MEGSSLPRSNASVFGGISKGMEGKSSKVDGGTYTPVDMATLKHSGTRGGLCSIYHEDVCVGCRSRACEEMESHRWDIIISVMYFLRKNKQ